tara:strand:- start:633 stop:905 length:273 start_codon:yes stop_codon:yes gene_type:complete
MAKRVGSKGLKRFILSEIRKLQEAEMSGELESLEDVETVEDAWSGGDNLEQDVDFMKALDIQEKRLVKKLRRIQEARNKLRKRVLKSLDK